MTLIELSERQIQFRHAASVKYSAPNSGEPENLLDNPKLDTLYFTNFSCQNLANRKKLKFKKTIKPWDT